MMKTKCAVFLNRSELIPAIERIPNSLMTAKSVASASIWNATTAYRQLAARLPVTFRKIPRDIRAARLARMKLSISTATIKLISITFFCG